MPTTPSSKSKRSYQDLLNVKFKPETVIFKPAQKDVERLLRKHGLFEFNIHIVMDDLKDREFDDLLDLEGYIENMTYYASKKCKYCYNQGCRICLGIDL